jgi:hypothetical protein
MEGPASLYADPKQENERAGQDVTVLQLSTNDSNDSDDNNNIAFGTSNFLSIKRKKPCKTGPDNDECRRLLSYSFNNKEIQKSASSHSHKVHNEIRKYYSRSTTDDTRAKPKSSSHCTISNGMQQSSFCSCQDQNEMHSSSSCCKTEDTNKLRKLSSKSARLPQDSSKHRSSKREEKDSSKSRSEHCCGSIGGNGVHISKAETPGRSPLKPRRTQSEESILRCVEKRTKRLREARHIGRTVSKRSLQGCPMKLALKSAVNSTEPQVRNKYSFSGENEARVPAHDPILINMHISKAETPGRSLRKPRRTQSEETALQCVDKRTKKFPEEGHLLRTVSGKNLQGCPMKRALKSAVNSKEPHVGRKHSFSDKNVSHALDKHNKGSAINGGKGSGDDDDNMHDSSRKSSSIHANKHGVVGSVIKGGKEAGDVKRHIQHSLRKRSSIHPKKEANDYGAVVDRSKPDEPKCPGKPSKAQSQRDPSTAHQRNHSKSDDVLECSSHSMQLLLKKSAHRGQWSDLSRTNENSRSGSRSASTRDLSFSLTPANNTEQPTNDMEYTPDDGYGVSFNSEDGSCISSSDAFTDHLHPSNANCPKNGVARPPKRKIEKTRRKTVSIRSKRVMLIKKKKVSMAVPDNDGFSDCSETSTSRRQEARRRRRAARMKSKQLEASTTAMHAADCLHMQDGDSEEEALCDGTTATTISRDVVASNDVDANDKTRQRTASNRRLDFGKYFRNSARWITTPQCPDADAECDSGAASCGAEKSGECSENVSKRNLFRLPMSSLLLLGSSSHHHDVPNQRKGGTSVTWLRAEVKALGSKPDVHVGS